MDITLILGPTAIGKSAYALQLAASTNAEIISADAFQVYRGLDIGTAKISPAEQGQIPHHLIDIKNPDEGYSVAEFLERTQLALAQIYQRKKACVICGGTALYLHAFLYGYELPLAIDPVVQSQLEKETQYLTPQDLWAELQKIDPLAAASIAYQNTRRVLRALLLYRQTGQLPSIQRHRQIQPRADVRLVELTCPRAQLYDRINQRVEHMLRAGFIEEVANLLKKGYASQSQAFQAIGYQEISRYLAGSLPKTEMVELIKTRTRHFAKRQLTWFRRFENVEQYNLF